MLKKILKIGTGTLAIVLLASCASIQQQYEVAKAANTFTAYEKFLSDNPKGTYAAAAERELERLRFEEAIAKDQRDALENLLAKYPTSQYAPDAKEALAKSHANALMREPSLQGFDSFFSRFKDTSAAATLHQPFEGYLNSRARSANTVESYVDYLTRLPKGANADELRRLAEPLWWEKRSEPQDIEEYRRYLQLFPGGAHRELVELFVDKEMWGEAEKTASNIALYEAYLQKFPNGPHSKEAQDCIDWAAAEKNGPRGVRIYHDAYPRGRFATKASEILASASQVTLNQKDSLKNKAMNDVRSALSDSRMSGGTIKGYMSSSKGSTSTLLSYTAIIERQGSARVIIDNGSTAEMGGIVYEYWDDEWLPSYRRTFVKPK